jgi:hypothetical protein
MPQLSVITQLMLSLILLGLGTASLELCFQHYLTPGMIFNWYAKWLDKKQDLVKEMVGTYKMRKFIGFNRLAVIKTSPQLIIGYLAKPLGLCPYCNGTWIAIVVYWYFFGLNLPIFLFIGINWLFIYTIREGLFFKMRKK